MASVVNVWFSERTVVKARQKVVSEASTFGRDLVSALRRDWPSRPAPKRRRIGRDRLFVVLVSSSLARGDEWLRLDAGPDQLCALSAVECQEWFDVRAL
jgi:hypothetical protein